MTCVCVTLGGAPQVLGCHLLFLYRKRAVSWYPWEKMSFKTCKEKHLRSLESPEYYRIYPKLFDSGGLGWPIWEGSKHWLVPKHHSTGQRNIEWFGLDGTLEITWFCLVFCRLWTPSQAGHPSAASPPRNVLQKQWGCPFPLKPH